MSDTTAGFLLMIWYLFLFGSMIWLGFDARKNKITTGAAPYNLLNGAGAWIVGCMLLGILVFPWYLVKRSRVLRARALEAPLEAQYDYNTGQSQPATAGIWPPAPTVPASGIQCPRCKTPMPVNSRVCPGCGLAAQIKEIAPE